jgi:hypothetical protein
MKISNNHHPLDEVPSLSRETMEKEREKDKDFIEKKPAKKVQINEEFKNF